MRSEEIKAGYELAFEDTFDGDHGKTVHQSPSYPIQLMLGVYEFPGEPSATAYPKRFTVDHVRGCRRR